jgi:hypothetical protein
MTNLVMHGIRSNKKWAAILLTLFFWGNGLFAASQPFAAEILKKIRLETDTISSWATLPLLVNAVKAQNAENLSIDTILKRDTAWIKIFESKGAPSDLMIRLQNSPAGKWLKTLRKQSQGKYRESFLCDNKGALVATSNITSDYFQGDEAKWIDCYNNGNGKTFIEAPEYDESSDGMLIKISVPVLTEGKTIGVLVVGVKFQALR